MFVLKFESGKLVNKHQTARARDINFHARAKWNGPIIFITAMAGERLEAFSNVAENVEEFVV